MSDKFQSQLMKKKLKKRKEIIDEQEEKEQIDEDYHNTISEIQKTTDLPLQEEKKEIEKSESEQGNQSLSDSYQENWSNTHTETQVDWNSVDEPSSIVEQKEKEKEKENELKQKRIVEKIIAEATFLKNSWSFDEYEKKIIEGLATAGTDNLELNRMLADFYFVNGNYKKALSLLKKITERDPEDHKSLWQIWEIYFVNGEYEEAEILIEKAINLRPDSPKYNLSLVEIFYNTHRKEDAINRMEKIIRLRPTNTNYMLTIAELYEEVKDFQNAKKYYFNVLEYEPTNEKAKRRIKELSEK